MAAPVASAPLVLVGGGLANGLIAYLLRHCRASIPLILIERGDTLGGNHTWSFHETDVSAGSLRWLQPFIEHRWQGQTVQFPTLTRQFSTPYCAISSARFHRVLSQALGSAVRTKTAVCELRPDAVVLADGSVLKAAAVIDGRGFTSRQGLELGWQKFLGLEIRTARPHRVVHPVIMDATVRQTDGYRFMYLLPFGPDRLLIEDTSYSDTPILDPDVCSNDIRAYARARGWDIADVVRAESGALPIALGGDLDAYLAARPGIGRAGLAAGLFHPTTGYSLPDAVSLAERICDAPRVTAEAIARLTRDQAREMWRRRRLYRLLNRMLFRAAAPDRRRQVLAHFYRLPQDVIERFYADRLTSWDTVRILSGRPPVPVFAALRAALAAPDRSAYRAEPRA